MARNLERPDPLTHTARHFIDRQTISRDRVPQPKEPNDRHIAIRRDFGFRQRLLAKYLADRLENEAPISVEMPLVIGAIGALSPLVQLGFRHPGSTDETLIEDETDGDPDGKCAATETKTKDLVTLVSVVAASELVERDYISAQTDAERATE